MLSCHEVSRLVSESLDRKLPFRQRLGVRLHLMMCRLCSRFLKQMKFLREAAHRLGEAEDGHNFSKVVLPSEARERIQSAIDAHS